MKLGVFYKDKGKTPQIRSEGLKRWGLNVVFTDVAFQVIFLIIEFNPHFPVAFVVGVVVILTKQTFRFVLNFHDSTGKTVIMMVV